MEFSPTELVGIVEQASTITDRLEPGFLFNQPPANSDRVNSRIQQWCQVVAEGNQETFNKRLAWDNLDLNTVLKALDSVRLAPGQSLPAWVETLNESLKAAATVSELEQELVNSTFNPNRYLNLTETITFAEVFLPFISVARKKLIAQTGESYQLLTETAHITLELQLLAFLSQLASLTLKLEFAVFCQDNNNIADLSANILEHEQYKNFINSLLAGGLLSFFQEYSVLARLIATAVDLWVDATGEFLQRLPADWLEIQQTFKVNPDLGKVVAIKPSLSDRHHQGRMVMALTFDCGFKLIYKPKKLGSEVAYFNLLAWLNQQGMPLDFKLLKVISHSTYGWVEFVEPLPCEDEQAAKAYYLRAGMLLCLMHVLEAKDCMCENIIACGEYPVLIDMETLMHPRFGKYELPANENQGAYFLANHQIWNSVLRTGLLPRWQTSTNGKPYDLSGLWGVNHGEEPGANVPTLAGVHLSPNNYVEELIAGFRQMYRFLLSHRELLLAPDSPLTELANQPIRFIFRSTKIYAFIFNKMLHPKFMRDGADWSIQLDVLSKALLSSETKHNFWSLVRAEQLALEQLDIPLFTAYPNSDTLNLADRSKEKFFTEPSYHHVIARLQQLSDADLEKQIEFIRGSLFSVIPAQPKPEKGEGSTSPPFPSREGGLGGLGLSYPTQLIEQAIEIAQDLQRRAIISPDGSATWIALGILAGTEQLQLMPMGYTLYDGACGIALFLAALEKVTGGAGFGDLALAALQPVRQAISASSQKNFQHIGIGAGEGWGSIIYGLVRISQFLDEPALLEDALLATSFIAPERIASDRQLDIIAGAAGAILGLLTLYQYTSDRTVLDLAITCGHHLLNQQLSTHSGYKAWKNLQGRFLTGFAHGAAGIAYALLRLYEITHNQLFLESAKQAIAYEGSLFSPIIGNWSDLRTEQPSYMTSWCHGAPGISLARLGSLGILDNSEIRQEIETALKTTQEFSLLGVDRLCCGNFGRIDVLLVAANLLGRQELLATALQKAAWLVTRAKQAGAYQLFWHHPKDVYHPSLFTGTAGIGYELLRLAAPDLLPSVLLWE